MIKLLSCLLSVPVLFALSVAHAANLCNQSCGLDIEYETFGYIRALEPVTITFGEGGFITTNDVTTGYAAGDTIEIVDGDPLVFVSGDVSFGRLNLGDGGNINFTRIEFERGVINLADSKAGMVNLGGVRLSRVKFLNLGSDAVLLAGDVLEVNDVRRLEIDVTESATLSILGRLDACDTLDFMNSLEPWGSDFTQHLSPDFFNGQGANFDITTLTEVCFDTTLMLNITYIDQLLFDPGSFYSLTRSNPANNPGVSFVASDGEVCTVFSGRCVTSSGEAYNMDVEKIEFVSAKSGNSSSDGASSISMQLLLCFLFVAYVRSKCFCIR